MSKIENNAGSGSSVAIYVNAHAVGVIEPEIWGCCEYPSPAVVLNACYIFRDAAKFSSKEACAKAFKERVDDVFADGDEGMRAAYIESLYIYRFRLCDMFMEGQEQQSVFFIAWIDETYHDMVIEKYQEAERADKAAREARAAREAAAAAEEEEEDSEVTCTICSATPAQH